jgi:hypothetical protein
VPNVVILSNTNYRRRWLAEVHSRHWGNRAHTTPEDSLLNGAHEDEATGMRKKKRGDWQKCVTLTMAVKARVREILTP